MQPGDRVQAHNPQLGDEERVPLKVDPDSSRLLRLRMTKDDGSGLDIALLRSLLWMERHQAYAGERIWLDLPELGAQGYADVIGEEPCPALMPGDAPLVTGKFVHAAANVVDLYVSGLAEPIGVTANHPFWSETRQDFVEAGDLVAGEALLGDGDQPLLVLHAIPRPEPQTVYNLEVDGEHVYAVTEQGILVHNACLTKLIGDLGEAQLSDLLNGRNGWKVLGSIQNSSGHGIDLVAEYTTKSGKSRLVFFEAKANSSRLSIAQAKGAQFFVASRLDRAVNNWKAIDPTLKTLARDIQRRIDRGEKFHGVVYYADLNKGTSFLKYWTP